jgi:hypothetical protein
MVLMFKMLIVNSFWNEMFGVESESPKVRKDRK